MNKTRWNKKRNLYVIGLSKPFFVFTLPSLEVFSITQIQHKQVEACTLKSEVLWLLCLIIWLTFHLSSLYSILAACGLRMHTAHSRGFEEQKHSFLWCVCEALWFSLYPLWPVITPNLGEASLNTNRRVVHLLLKTRSHFSHCSWNVPCIWMRRRGRVGQDKPATDRWLVTHKFQLKPFISLIFRFTAMHAEHAPERKANMLIQCHWIPSEVFPAVCCQNNSMILSLFLILVPPPPSPHPVAVICCFVYVSSKSCLRPKWTHHPRAFGEPNGNAV